MKWKKRDPRVAITCAVSIVLCPTGASGAVQELRRSEHDVLVLVPGVPLDLGPARDGSALRFAPGTTTLVDAAPVVTPEDARCDPPELDLAPADSSAGTVVGRAAPRGPNPREEGDLARAAFAYLCDASGFRALRAPDQVSSAALGVNAHGQAVGSYRLADGEERAFLWEAAGMLDLEAFADAECGWRLVRAFDVDEDGTVVGLGERAGEARWFLLHTGGGVRTLDPGSLALRPTGPVAPPVPAPNPGPPTSGPAPCQDAGAELGLLGSWTCARTTFGGALAPVDCAFSPNHVVLAGTPDLAGTPLPTVSPIGGIASILIGDALSGDDVGSDVGFVDAIERTFTVSTVNPIVHYLYALVLEDPDHDPADQPYFRVRVFVPPTAATPVYDFRKLSDASDPFFTDLGNGLVMRDWSCARIDLTAYAGLPARMLVEVADCGLGGHFGYAYFDIPCDPYRVALAVPPCLGSPPTIDGSANLPAVAHFWSVQESDLDWNRYGIEATDWFNGSAGTLDIEAFFEARGGTYVCGKRYRVGLALRTECEPWISTGRLVYANCVEAGPDRYTCPWGPPVTLAVSSVEPPVQYTWSTLAGQPVGTGASVAVLPPVTTTYVLTAWDPVTGCTTTDNVVVHVLQDFTVQVTACRCGGDVRLTASADRLLGPDVTYSWSPGGQTGQTVTVHPGSDVPTTYTVTVTNLCYSRQGSIAVAGAPPVHLIAPNTFTPNGDGLNDVFEVFHMGIDAGDVPAYDAEAMTLRIYDRWGGVVFARQWAAPTCGAFANGVLEWDGIANKNVNYSGLFWRPDVTAGQPVPLGVYTYKVYLARCGSGSVLTPVNGQHAPSVLVLP